MPSAGVRSAGQRTAPSSSTSPRSSSATTASCSAEVSSRGGRLTPQQCGAAEDAVGVGVQGARQRLADGLRDAAGDARAQLGGGLAAEGQDEDLLGVQPRLDPGGDRLDDRRGLAGAGTGEDQQRPGRVVDDGLLGGVEARGRHRRPLAPAPAGRPVPLPPVPHLDGSTPHRQFRDGQGRVGAGPSISARAASTVSGLEHQVRRGGQPARDLQQRPLALGVERRRRRDEPGLGHGPARDVVHGMVVGTCPAEL